MLIMITALLHSSWTHKYVNTFQSAKEFKVQQLMKSEQRKSDPEQHILCKHFKALNFSCMQILEIYVP